MSSIWVYSIEIALVPASQTVRGRAIFLYLGQVLNFDRGISILCLRHEA